MTAMTEFRKKLYSSVYCYESQLHDLISYLSSELSLNNYELDVENKSIKLKIRKSVYNKKSSFNHCVDYYYPIIDSAFYRFLYNIYMHLDHSTEEARCYEYALQNNLSLLYNNNVYRSDNINHYQLLIHKKLP